MTPSWKDYDDEEESLVLTLPTIKTMYLHGTKVGNILLLKYPK